MAEKRYFFENFALDPVNRHLTREGETLPVSGRYFDVLALLVAHAGQLVSKDRFMAEAWDGAAVTDEALTQAIRTLRRTLGDTATNPRLIRTVPGHGYRFVADVRTEALQSPASDHPGPGVFNRWAALIPVATGGALAGLVGGTIYGSILSSTASGTGSGAVSTLLVIAAVCAGVGLIAGVGVGAGLMAANLFPGPVLLRRIAGGALGGFAVGSLTKLVGADALSLMFGVGLPGMTGGGEGLLLGAATGLAVHGIFAGGSRWPTAWALTAGAFAGLASGLAIHVLGGRLMAGSLSLLMEAAPGAQLDLGPLAAVSGEDGFGPLSLAIATMFEAGLFTVSIAATLAFMQARQGRPFSVVRPDPTH